MTLKRSGARRLSCLRRDVEAAGRRQRAERGHLTAGGDGEWTATQVRAGAHQRLEGTTPARQRARPGGAARHLNGP
jgi:hypothetical protein